jgi:hypothetical protein
MSEVTENTPFFIAGAGRSCATLLQPIHAGHPRIHIPPENLFIKDVGRELPLTLEPLNSVAAVDSRNPLSSISAHVSATYFYVTKQRWQGCNLIQRFTVEVF